MSFLCIAPASLHRLRQQLHSHDPVAAAKLLHEAGFATGELMAQGWKSRLAERAHQAERPLILRGAHRLKT